MRHRPSPRSLCLALVGLVTAPLAARAQSPERPVNYVERYVGLTWYRSDVERGAWPATGSPLDASALDCEALGEGGGRPIRCAPIALTAELRETSSRLAQCFALRDRRMAPAAVATYARTGVGPAGALVFVRMRTHQTEAVHGPCRRQGIDACMGVVGPVVGHRVLRVVQHDVLTGADDRRADDFEAVSGSGPWLAPADDAAWPAAPEGGAYDAARPTAPEGDAYDEAPLVARTAAPNAVDQRFAAWVDLVTARLHRGDADGARAALARAAELSTALTGTGFVAPDLARSLTVAEVDAIADGTEALAVRHARLRAIVGSHTLRDAADQQHAIERARDLRARITPPAAASRLFFHGDDPRVYVPTVLGGLHRIAHARWGRPCPEQAPTAVVPP